MLARLFTSSFLAVALMAQGAVAADIALAKKSMLLFGGPSVAYPRIGMITWGQGLQVVGCDRTAGWCEVAVDGQRGWVEGHRLTWPEFPAYRKVDVRHDAVRVTI